MTKSSLLLVDDDRQVLESMADWLRDQGYDLDPVVNFHDAVAALDRKNYDLVISDIRMEGHDGFELLSHCRQNHPSATVILMTGYGTGDMAVDAINRGAFDFLTKPLIDEELEIAINETLFPLSYNGLDNNPRMGIGFGLGFRVITNINQSGLIGNDGSYGWGGMANTMFWIDPKENLVDVARFEAVRISSLIDRNIKVKSEVRVWDSLRSISVQMKDSLES